VSSSHEQQADAGLDTVALDHPIKVGSMLYTLVDPHRGHEAAYNRWYERDHFYAGCMVGPWLFSGGRWVATADMKRLRFPADSPYAEPVTDGSYLAMYWVLEGRYGDHFGEWSIPQVQWLYANNRGFADRTHVHTKLYVAPWTAYRDADPVPLELALDHGYAGLITIFVARNDDVDEADFQRYLRDTALPPLLADSPIAMAAQWKPEPPSSSPTGNAPMPLGSLPGGPERTMQLLFCESNPADVWDRVRAYAASIEESGLGSVLFCAPFLATVVGTDTYTDQLWLD
jgi:hypothetical protein